MPTLNSALWDTSQDDIWWIQVSLTNGWTGYLYARLFNGQRLVELWGGLTPPAPLAWNAANSLVAYMPANYYPRGGAARWIACWANTNVGTGLVPASIELTPSNSDRALYALACGNQINSLNLHGICSLDL